MNRRLLPQSGLSFVELIMTMTLIGILGAGSVGLLSRFVQTSLYLPNASRVSQGAGAMLEATIEGSWTSLPVPTTANPLRGLQFSRQLLAAERSCIRIRNVDSQDYTIWRDATNSQLLRGQVGADTSWEPLPYYATEAAGHGKLIVQGRAAPEVVFRYFEVNPADGSETELIPDTAGSGAPCTGTSFNGATRVLSQVDRIEVGVVVRTRNGSIDQSDGRVELASSVYNRFP